MFSKKKISKKNKNNYIFKIIILTSFLLVSFFAFYTFYHIKTSINSQKNENNQANILEKLNLFNKKNFLTNEVKKNNKNKLEENLEKNKENKKNKINILLVGRWWELNDAPNLTDTIILASINNKYKTISMLSIPRDLYVEYKNKKYWKINKIYALKKAQKYNEEEAMKALIYNVKQITNQNVDYFINIDFKGFIKFINAIGWVTIKVPKTLIDKKYPTSNWWYRKLIIKKWTWNFDWKTALMYARSRHSTSDFDRNLRQQQIISAIRNKLTSGDFLSKLYKIKQLYDVFTKYTKSNIDLNAILKIVNWVSDKYKIISFNLNDSCWTWYCEKWGFLYLPAKNLFWWASVLLINWSDISNLNNYSKLKVYTDLIFNNPDIFIENPKIKIFNSTKTSWIAYKIANKLRKYWLNIPKKNYIWNIKDENFLNSTIYYNSNIKNSKTLKFIKEKLNIKKAIEVSYPEYAMDSEIQIEIVLGKDYKEIINNLNKNLK